MRASRDEELRKHHFTPLESRMLRELPRNNAARKAMIQDRDDRWERFTRVVGYKVRSGKWTTQEIVDKWTANLSRMYTKNHLRVQYGPSGHQQRMPKGSINPWALYRYYERQLGGPDGKAYVSPWQIRQIRTGKTPLQRGLIFVQGAERRLQSGMVNKSTVTKWIEQKDEAIKKARGKKKVQLMIEKRRLERLL